MSERRTVTRFAPSPTGELHVGGARTALFSWAFARGRDGGRFILRLEDTDQARSTTESARRIVAELLWLGLDWDEGPALPGRWDQALDSDYDPYAYQAGQHGPYFQSQRLDLYQEHVDRLLACGRAYDDGGAVRFRVDEPVVFDDAVFGRVEVDAAEIEDFVIRKGDGYPTFHLAVVVDDHLMGVSHVIRGQEHLSNTPKHAALFDALGFDRPVWAHTPSILNTDGSKMSKRDKAKAARLVARNACKQAVDEDVLIEKTFARLEAVKGLSGPPRDVARDAIRGFLNKGNDDTYIAQGLANVLNVPLPEIDVSDFRDSGYLPETLCNYVSLLGWSPGGDVEKFDNTFLIQNFSIDRIGKSNARFDRDKLFRFNADAIAALPEDAFRKLLFDNNSAYWDLFSEHDDPKLVLFARAYHQRSHTLCEPLENGGFFFVPDQDVEYDAAAVDKVLSKGGGEGFDVLRSLRPVLDQVDPWEAEQINQAIHGFAGQRKLGMKKVAQPLRVAVSGGTVSPPLDQTLLILGKDPTLARIDRCLAVTARSSN